MYLWEQLRRSGGSEELQPAFQYFLSYRQAGHARSKRFLLCQPIDVCLRCRLAGSDHGGAGGKRLFFTLNFLLECFPHYFLLVGFGQISLIRLLEGAPVMVRRCHCFTLRLCGGNRLILRVCVMLLAVRFSPETKKTRGRKMDFPTFGVFNCAGCPG
jgi:hypothetical protein